MMTKPMLFSTDMVRAILDGRKTVTRRVMKPQPPKDFPYCHLEGDGLWYWTTRDWDDDMMDWWPSYEHGVQPICQPGDILYVPEAWKCRFAMLDPDGLGYEVIFRDRQHVRFRFETEERAKKWVKYARKPQEYWQSPYFMPREAARIFLRVMDVRAERLQGITVTGLQEEGLLKDVDTSQYSVVSTPDLFSEFQQLWDSTIKPADRTLYGWLANPWVWVIEFERISREEAL